MGGGRSMRLLLLLIAMIPSLALADGLVIHASEFIVGKFHRFDNSVHPYSEKNVWKNYVLPEKAATDKPITQKNPDGSFSIFASNLRDMMSLVVQISRNEGQPVSV